jgi:rSAM/selenodomain-associated transferase 1
MKPPCPVIVMAKAPRPGLAKTRLIPALGAAGAAALAGRLLDHALEQALSAGLGPVDLCCAPDASDPAFQRHAARPALVLSQQSQGDLGQRMQSAFACWLPAQGGVLMMGTDIPGLLAPVLQQAAAALQAADAVFVPAIDGGYTLIGLRQPAPSLFIDMPWSTAAVMATTRQRLAAAGLRHVELAPLPDIDEPADLAWLPDGWLAAR